MSDELQTAMQDYVKALSEMDNAKFDKVNPHFKNKYASLASVRAAYLPVLGKYNLALKQTIKQVDDGSLLVTEIIHASGAIMDSCEMRINEAQKTQQLGSELTYLRRYSASLVTGISCEDDDDGNEGQETEPKKKPLQGAIKSRTALKQQIGNFSSAINKAQSVGEFDDICADYKDVTDQAKSEALDLLTFDGGGDGVSIRAQAIKIRRQLVELEPPQ